MQIRCVVVRRSVSPDAAETCHDHGKDPILNYPPCDEGGSEEDRLGAGADRFEENERTLLQHQYPDPIGMPLAAP
jgi:hypothetical protein